ncbi:unnamed protein product [Caenorhabditis angaria]|uniref:C-type lectin domain-containing protein n=1 Tax=Caenorhabditis angaria TaxID=860376 RepID=A0A9P1IQP3_9PELO|nr:unnamed protein product [Caenorhabditis angaria]
MLFLLYFLQVPLTFTVKVAKLEIPYEYLATRDHPSSANYNMNDNFNDALQKAFDSSCKSNRCYFPVFNDSGVLKYTILTDVNSTCLSYPNCLGFTQEQYQNYSIVFGDPSIQDDNLMDRRSYEVAKCASGYFSFTRANGLNWCADINKTSVTHSEAENACEADGKYLNGFQFIEEQEDFLIYMTSQPARTIHLGATRSSKNMTTDMSMIWNEAIVSTNQTLANNLKLYYGNGEFLYLLVLSASDRYYGRHDNTTSAYYSCGWYAT